MDHSDVVQQTDLHFILFGSTAFPKTTDVRCCSFQLQLCDGWKQFGNPVSSYLHWANVVYVGNIRINTKMFIFVYSVIKLYKSIVYRSAGIWSPFLFQIYIFPRYNLIYSIVTLWLEEFLIIHLLEEAQFYRQYNYWDLTWKVMSIKLDY